MSTDGQSIEAAFAEAQQSAHASLLDDGQHTFDCAGCAAACAVAMATYHALAMYVIDEAVLEGVRTEIEALGSGGKGV